MDDFLASTIKVLYPSITEEQLQHVGLELLTIVHQILPSAPLERAIPIALESARRRERLSSTPFYANRAMKDGNEYWVRSALSYQGTQ